MVIPVINRNVLRLRLNGYRVESCIPCSRQRYCQDEILWKPHQIAFEDPDAFLVLLMLSTSFCRKNIVRSVSNLWQIIRPTWAIINFFLKFYLCACMLAFMDAIYCMHIKSLETDIVRKLYFIYTVYDQNSDGQRGVNRELTEIASISVFLQNLL